MLGLLGGLFATHLSSRACGPPTFSSDEQDAGAGEGASVTMSGTACAIGATQSCNVYGTETCVSGGGLTLSLGVWGPCSCPPSPSCSPGASQSCGNCGNKTCDACGQWKTCANQGLCTPGDTGPDGCYEGEDAFCNQSCQWVCP